MNKERRARIASIVKMLEEIRDEIDDVCMEEQEYYDYMPESIQEGEKGAAASEAIGWLDTASGYITDAVMALEDAQA